MSKVDKILVPDILPNNLRNIRSMREMQLKDVADALAIDRNFLSAVEVGNKNFSGKTTIRALKYYNISFYKMYDVKESLILDTTDLYDNTFRTTLSFDPQELLNINVKDYEKEHIENIINVTISKDLNDLRENNLIINEINKVAKKNKVKGLYDSFEIVGVSYADEKLYLDLEVIYKEKRTEKITHDIHFVENENIKLADMLRYKGFLEDIKSIEKQINGDTVRIDGNRVYLGDVYKLPVGDDINKFTESDYINLSDKDLKITYDEITKEPVSVRFKVIKQDMTNLKAITTLTNISIDEMHKSLGLSYNGYMNLVLGNQKISTKIMWRLVKKLNLPLELILNIDEYYEKFCIKSPRVNGDIDIEEEDI